MAGVKLVQCNQCYGGGVGSEKAPFKPSLVEFPYTWKSPVSGEAHGWHVVCGNPACRHASRAILAQPKQKSLYPKYKDAARVEWNQTQRFLEMGEAHRTYWLGRFVSKGGPSYAAESKYVERWFKQKYGPDWSHIVNDYGDVKAAPDSE